MSDLFEDFADNMTSTYNRRVPIAWCASHRDDPGLAQMLRSDTNHEQPATPG